MPRPWESLYPGGLPYVEPADEPVHELLDQVGSRSPERCAALQLETSTCLTWSGLAEASKRVAGLLRSLGVGRGSQVLFASFNRVEALAGLLGIWRAGGAAVLVDPLTISEDLQSQLEGRPIRVGVVSSQFFERERETLAKSGVESVLVVDSQPREAQGLRVYSMGDAMKEDPVAGDDVRGGDVSVIMYYAGIAGRTMQVYHTHTALSTAIKALAATMRLGFEPTSIVVAPITHVLGLQVSTLTPLYMGGRAVMMQRWSAALALSAIEIYGVNYVSGAPMMHDDLVSEALKRGGLYGVVKLGLSGGAPLKGETQEAFNRAFGAPLVQFYGMTESWVLTFQPLLVSDVKGTVGAPIADVDVKIVDPSNPSLEKGVGEVGELLARAPWIMKGYEDEGETKGAIIDGWLRTGDLMVMDSRGLLYFRGVRKRMIKYKAYPIFPKDLEAVLLKHPAVERAYVYGEPDPDVGERPVAKVILKQGMKGSVTEEDLLKFVNSRVAFYKKLHRVYIVDSIPELG